MRVALLSYNARSGDAIGNQVAEKLAFFLERGADVRVFVEDTRCLHPVVRAHTTHLPVPEPTGDAWQFLNSADLVVVEYGQAYRLLQLLPLLAGRRPRILFDYHGVTPASCWGAHNRQAVEDGSRLRGYVWCADAAIAHSAFTARELTSDTGYPGVWLRVLPHPVDLARFQPGPPRRSLCDRLRCGRAPLLLFVGRLAPNKRVPLLVEALGKLNDLGQPHLAIVGDAGDAYAAEADHCRRRATELGLAERVHLLGQLDDAELADAYRSADVMVLPSIHEGFGVPLLEAMACGVPVVAARAGALPGTVGSAGLTFTPDDADDLARQVRRILASPRRAPCVMRERSPRVAVVAVRFGDGFAGGAERSLSTVARALHDTGCEVEVFTTCTQSESDWSNELPEGDARLEGLTVHRYRIDLHDRTTHHTAVRAILEAEGAVSEEMEQEYLRHSVHSSRLLEALAARIDELDAIVVGPYLFGLTYDVASRFPDKAVLVPCFHDEPFVRLRVWRPVYERAGAILYHSPEEQELAETELGLNHPGAQYLGTILPDQPAGDAERGRARVGGRRPYLVYCGRYSPQKNLPLLLDYARRYEAVRPGRFAFAFLGEGQVAIPREDWARDLGFVEERDKRDLLAGSAALVQLSRFESLSLVALEAWREGVPVLADAGCAVLAGQLRRSGGGRAVSSFAEFAAALDDLWEHPESWQAMGARGRTYVADHFASGAEYAQRLRAVLDGLGQPLAERLREQGLRRAATHDRQTWRKRLDGLVEELLHAPRRPSVRQVEVRPRTAVRTVSAGMETALVPVHVRNRGSHAIVPDGPGRAVLRAEVETSGEAQADRSTRETALPGLLLPGRKIAAAVRVPVPEAAGRYEVTIHVCWETEEILACRLQLVVEAGRPRTEEGCCAPLLDEVHAALAKADGRQQLPDDYTDVTAGLLAPLKRRVKRKLLGNFKQSYIDVLSRQQSAFNRHVLDALGELAECCALLDHARGTAAPDERALLGAVQETLAALRHRCETIEERVAALERGSGAGDGVVHPAPAALG
jgi:glycosyltransferase involved in cell wall biosynthesis